MTAALLKKPSAVTPKEKLLAEQVIVYMNSFRDNGDTALLDECIHLIAHIKIIKVRNKIYGTPDKAES